MLLLIMMMILSYQIGAVGARFKAWKGELSWAVHEKPWFAASYKGLQVQALKCPVGTSSPLQHLRALNSDCSGGASCNSSPRLQDSQGTGSPHSTTGKCSPLTTAAIPCPSYLNVVSAEVGVHLLPACEHPTHQHPAPTPQHLIQPDSPD